MSKIDSIRRERCRREFEERFTSEVMIAKYERVYRRLIACGEIEREFDTRQPAVGR